MTRSNGKKRPIADISSLWHPEEMASSGPKWMSTWAQRLQWLFLIFFVLWFALIMFGEPWEQPYVTMAVFAAMMGPAVVRAYFMLHAVARGDISPLSTRSRRTTDD